MNKRGLTACRAAATAAAAKLEWTTFARQWYANEVYAFALTRDL